MGVLAVRPETQVLNAYNVNKIEQLPQCLLKDTAFKIVSHSTLNIPHSAISIQKRPLQLMTTNTPALSSIINFTKLNSSMTFSLISHASKILST